MPHLTTDDGVKLYYEETGKGIPIVFVHEFAGDCRSWEQQVRHFGKYYRCITFNARGYPPSDVPKDQEKYSQERARDDIRSVLDALKIDKAHVVGLSMGGFATLHFGFTYGNRARSIVVAGCGYGAAPGERAKFAEEAEAWLLRGLLEHPRDNLDVRMVGSNTQSHEPPGRRQPLDHVDLDREIGIEQLTSRIEARGSRADNGDPQRPDRAHSHDSRGGRVMSPAS